MGTEARTTLTGVAPMFLVDDVVKTAEWYRDVLGFTIGMYYREEAEHEHDEHGNHLPGYEDDGSGAVFFTIIERDGLRVMLSLTLSPGQGVTSNAAFKQETSDAYFWADDIQPLFERARSAGGDIAMEPATQFYGIREFQVRDCDGRLLTFGAPVEA